MTTIAARLDGPRVLRAVPTVTDNELPLSGFRAVVTERASSRRSGRRRIDVAADPNGEFWIAEAALASTRVSVTVAGVAAGQGRLHPVPAVSTQDR